MSAPASDSAGSRSGASTDPPGSAAEYFGAMAERYDDLIRRAVPRYDELSDRLIEYLPDAARILELGCGTGRLSLALAARFPHATLTCVDASPEMVEITRSRLTARDRAFAARNALVTARFARP